MAIIINDKAVAGKPSFSVTVYKPPLKQIRGSVYEAEAVEFEIDYIDTSQQLIRFRRKNDKNVLYDKNNTKFTDNMKKITIRSVFEANKIIRNN